jgi:RNA polymerase sigma factor (sigma-70 family)
MVWGVCRRLLPHTQDAEDAFQATFLVLARKAAAVRPGSAVGNWLYGVARRAALKARAAAARRAAVERQVAAAPEPAAAPDPQRDLVPVVDAALARVPDKYRLAVVLCDLEGLTRAEAARRLGWPEGTVASRLAEGRSRLARLLARSGLTVSGAALAAVLSPASGIVAGAETPSPGASALADEVLRSMIATRMGTAALICLALGLTTAGAAATLARVEADRPPARPTARAASSRPDDPKAAAPAGPADRNGDALPRGALARLGTVRWRHGETIGCGAFAPDASLLAVAGAPRGGGGPAVIRLFDPATGRVVRTLRGHDRAVRSLDFSPDGKTLLSAGIDGTLRTWDVATGAQQAVLIDKVRDVHQARFSPDGKQIAAGVDVEFKRWYLALFDAATGKEAARLDIDARTLAFSPDGKFLATTGAWFERPSFLIDVAARRAVCELNDGGAADAVAFAPNGASLVTYRDPGIGAAEATLTFRDLPTGKPTQRVAVPTGAAGALRFTPDGRTLISSRGLWSVASGAEIRLPDSVGSVFAASTGAKLLAGHRRDGVIGVWDAETGKQRAVPVGHAGAISLVLPVDGRRVLTFGEDDTAVRWDAGTAAPLGSEAVGRLWSNRFAASADRKVLAGVTAAQKVLVYDPTGDRRPRELSAAKDGGAWSLGLSGDGSLLAAVPLGGAKDQSIRLIDTAKDAVVGKVGGELGRAESVALSPDGKTVAIGTRTGAVHFLAAATGRPVRTALTLSGVGPKATVGRVVFAPDGASVAAWERSGAVRVWDLATGKERDCGTGWEDAVAFAPDSRLLALADRTGAVVLRDAATGEERARLTGHLGPVNTIAFSEDGRRLYTGSDDTTVLVWDLVALPRPKQ